MRRFVFFLLLLMLLRVQTVPAQESARSIIKKADDLMRGKTMTGKYTMKVIRPTWERTMIFDFWSEGTERSFIRMLSPAKNKGVTFLKIKREMWNYIPKINRVIKIPPSMMLQSWMGSDFTNDDLVRESSIVEDYWHTLLRRDMLGDDEAYVIELKPTPEAAVVYDKIIEWIHVQDYVPLKAEFYNERNERTRTIVYSEVKRFGKRKIPTVIELLEDKKPGHKTMMILEEGTFDVSIPKSVFTKQNLRKK